MKVNWISCKRFVIMMLNILILVQISSCTKESNLHPQQGPMPSPAPDEPVYMNLTSATQAINSNIGGYFVALPSNYTKTSNAFPLLVYMHGAGQMGNGSTDLHLLLKDGVAQVLRDKKFPGSFTVNGNTHSLIVLMPQVKSFPGTDDVKASIEMAKKKWRIDASRIYVSGLSAGSMAACDLAAQMPSQIAALVPMAGVSTDYATTDKCQRIASAKLPVWAFHSADDAQVSVDMTKGFVQRLASLNPINPPKLTIWPSGGHDAWTRAVNPDYKENGKNIYEWMLQYTK